MTEEQKILLQQTAKKAFQKYRGSGFSLMATIITLSAGAMAGILAHPHLSICLAFIFLVPIFIALFQQTYSYMGELHEAQAHHIWSERAYIDSETDEGLRELIATSEKGIKEFDKGNWWYGRADKLCWAGVITFMLAASSTVIFLTILRNHTKSGRIAEGLKMSQIEEAVGKPDRIEFKKGTLARNGDETPPIIIWYYDRFPLITSDDAYGKAGHINFVPKRFLGPVGISKEDLEARRLKVEQSDTYRTVSFSGSFLVDKSVKWQFGYLDFIPIKSAKK